MIKIEGEDHGVMDALNRLLRAADDPSQALRNDGKLLVESTKQCFAGLRGPGSEPSLAVSFGTIQRLLAKKSAACSKKTGTLTKTSAGVAMAKKP